MSNIVHFGKYYAPDPGGIESVTVSLSRGAVQYGHSVFVVCFRKNSGNSEEVIDGVKVLRAPIDMMLASQPLGRGYFFECVKAAKHADIVHLHAPNMLAAFCALFIKKKSRLLIHWHSDVINKGVLGKILRPLESALLRRANTIIAASPIYAGSSTTLAPYMSKVKVVPYGTFHKEMDFVNSELSTFLLHKIRGRKIILAVGRLVPYKGFSVLINAAKYLCDDAVVVIVGDGPLESDLHQQIDDAGIGERIVLAGRLSDDELHILFERATLFCLPSTSRAEAFGVVLIEAMSYSLPIVASDIPGSGVPWVNEHGVSGLNVTVGDSVAFADACNQIMTSPKLRNKFSQGARQRYTTQFTEGVSIKRIIEIYNQMLTVEV